MVSSSADVTSSTPLMEPVGDVRQAEAELDRAIKELGDKAVHAEAAGDHAGARELSDRMLAAIRGRTPEHQARLEGEALARVERSLDQGCCYFAAEGDKARAAVERKTV